MSSKLRPGTFERVYATLKAAVREGRYRPGARLEPAHLSDELNASVTPVRDALHRLTGERLVEAPPHEGFRMPLLTETVLRQLYGWHRDLVLLALATRRLSTLTTTANIADNTSSSTRLHGLLIELSRTNANPEHVHALQAVTDRLAPLLRLETLLLDAVEEESSEIIAALEARDLGRLRSSLRHYYRRRERIVPELLDRLYAAPDLAPD